MERYQLALSTAGHAMLKRFDQQYLAAPEKDAAAYLTACNQQLADKARELTDDLLSKVLFSASMEMKNGFARSDS